MLKSLEIFHTVDVSILLRLFIYFVTYLISIDIYFTPWALFILLLMLFQLWPLGSLSVGYCVPPW